MTTISTPNQATSPLEYQKWLGNVHKLMLVKAFNSGFSTHHKIGKKSD
jgi:hypothetical protein